MLLLCNVNVKRHINNHLNCFRWGCAQMRSVSGGVFYPWCFHSTQAATELQTAAWLTGAGRGIQRCYPRGKMRDKNPTKQIPVIFPGFLSTCLKLFVPGFGTLWNPHRSYEIGWGGIFRWTRENRNHRWVSIAIVLKVFTYVADTKWVSVWCLAQRCLQLHWVDGSQNL